MICRQCSREVTPDSFFCQWCSAYLPAPGRGRKAGIVRRGVAFVIDPLIALALYGAGLVLALMVGGIVGGPQVAAGVGLVFFLAFSLAYFVWFLTLLPKGLTPGKMLVGLQVLNLQTGAIPGFGTMFIREMIGRYLSGLFFGLGYFWALWDRDGQAWHDKLASTVVVKTTD